MNFKYIIFFLAFAVFSCQKDPEVGGTNMQELAGEWFVITRDNSGKQVVGYNKILTYNTNDNSSTSMWLNLSSIFKLKLTVEANPQNLQFQMATHTEGKVIYSITNGKIIKGAATTSGGNRSDSIYFEIKENDDIYVISGYKRTGFLDDEH